MSSPDGGFVYLTAFADNNVAVFSRNASTGKMTFVEKKTNLGGGIGGGPQALVLSPAGGAHLYVASSKGSVTALDRDSGTGLLTFIEVELDGEGGVTGLGNASGLTISPDGDHVYVTGEADDSVVIFSRDSGTGELTYVATLVDTPNIAGPRGLIVSPDGLHVYVTARSASSLTVYSRNVVSGVLTFIEKHEDDTSGVDGLSSAVSVAVSPNGAHVYLLGETDEGVAVFSRNPGTGALTVVEYELGDIRFVHRLSSIVVSDDGTHVFAAGRSRDSVVLFDRNATTGELTFVAGEKLLGASAVAVSPDGAHVYAGTRGDNKLFKVFRLSEVGCSATPLFGCAVPSQAGKSLLLLRTRRTATAIRSYGSGARDQ